MSGREKDPGAWVEKAEHDLLAIRSLVAGSSVPWDIVTFHAQQGAEKYLKGFLVLHEKVVPKVHDLERLLQLCVAIDPSLSSHAADCRRLTQLGFVSRYPDSPDDPSESDAREAMRLADGICDAVRPLVRRPDKP
jgi:HEPN domain-containing protein